MALLLTLAVTGVGLAQTPLPQPMGHVNDFAEVIPADVEAGLEDSLRQFEVDTSVELAVVTIPSLDGAPIEDYAVRLFQQWGIGKKDVDNGVLMVLAVQDRDVRIEVGYGMETYLTDGQVGRILDTQVLPELGQNNYALGILKGMKAVAETIKTSDYQPGAVRPRPPLGAVAPFLVAALFGIVYLASFLARSKSFWLGGVLGAVGGAVLGWVWGGLWPIIALPIGLGILGLLLDALLSSAYTHQKTSGRPTRWASTLGGFSGAGRGGWSGGKSFGGFGGGRSGGGGASRRF